MVNGLRVEFGWGPENLNPLLNILEVRNDESHRSPESLKKNIDILETKLEHMKNNPEISEKEISKLKK